MIIFGRTQTAIQTPFDNTAPVPYFGTDVQAALEELRNQPVLGMEPTTTTAGGTRTLTNANKNFQVLRGSAAGYTLVHPDARTLFQGWAYVFYNGSSQPITVKDGTGAVMFTLGQTSIAYCYLQDNSTQAGIWITYQVFTGGVASGIVNYNIESTTPFATTSASDVLITGFTVTPQAGTYAIWVNASLQFSTGNAAGSLTVYKAGISIPDSVRAIQSAGGSTPFSAGSQTIAQVNGSQTIDARVKTSGGTLTANQRSLLLIRLGT